MGAGPDRPLRVFVSHTAELAAFPERQSYVEAACAAVRRAGGVAVDMADFGARDEIERSAQVCRVVRPAAPWPRTPPTPAATSSSGRGVSRQR